MATLSQATLDAIAAAVAAALTQTIAAKPARTAEASAHYTAKDIACTKACGKTFRTAKGLAWHIANVRHA